MTDTAAIAKMAAELSPAVDVVINNAGYFMEAAEPPASSTLESTSVNAQAVTSPAKADHFQEAEVDARWRPRPLHRSSSREEALGRKALRTVRRALSQCPPQCSETAL